MMAKFYYAFENLALSPTDWTELVDRFKERGAEIVPPLSPEQYIHIRTSLDGQKVIFEANFNPNAVNPNGVRGQLVGIVGVPANQITFVQTSGDDLTVVYSVSGVPSLRQITFGNTNTTWLNSRDNTLDYIQANPEDWEEQPP